MFHARIRQLRAETLVLTDRHCKRDVRMFGFMAREDGGLELVAKHWCDRPHVRRRCEGGYFVVEVTEVSDLELEGRASAPSCRIQSSHSISDHSGNRGPRATATAAKWCIPSTSPLLDSRRPSFPSGDVRMDQGAVCSSSIGARRYVCRRASFSPTTSGRSISSFSGTLDCRQRPAKSGPHGSMARRFRGLHG